MASVTYLASEDETKYLSDEDSEDSNEEKFLSETEELMETTGTSLSIPNENLTNWFLSSDTSLSNGDVLSSTTLSNTTYTTSRGSESNSRSYSQSASAATESSASSRRCGFVFQFIC